jgi:hypothetical protein
MPEMPEILKRCELPIGTLVEVHKYHEDRPFEAIVRGYDMGHSKFEVGRKYMSDQYDDGGTWVFPQEIIGFYLGDQEFKAEAHPEPPAPMPWSEYEHLIGQPVEARYTEMPQHIYGEPEERIVRGILEESDGGLRQVRHFYGHAWERFPWESVRALDYAELTTQDLRDWMADNPKAATEFAFDALFRKARADVAREAAIEDMRH